jgi:GT2 family glycosyltransferase
MGVSKAVFEKVGGYKNMLGEDIDLSIRIKSAGFKTTLIKDAFVFHKRRVDLQKFYKQVNAFGKARVLLHRMHKGSLKLVHLLPMFFVLVNIALVVLSLFFLNPLWLTPTAIYAFALFTESLVKNKKIIYYCIWCKRVSLTVQPN